MERDLQDVTNVMKKNLDSVLERGEKMNSLVGKTDMLANQSHSFRRAAVEARQKQWWETVRDKLIMAIVLLALLWCFMYLVCGWNIWPF